MGKYIVLVGLLLSMPLPAGAQACPAWHGVVQLRQSVQLPPGCVFSGVELRVEHQQGLVLDMNGARFNADGHKIRGLWVMNTRPGRPSRDVVFKNAVFDGYLEGVRVHRNISPAEARQVKAGRLSLDKIRATATHHIRLENIQVLNSLGNGVVFHGGVHHVRLTGSVVANSGGVGIYFGDMTHHIEVSGSQVYGNGYRKPDGSSRRGRGRRENIAIDGSFNNRIVGNTIRDAAEGGIAVYKNCYEHADDVGQLPRLDAAQGNGIYGNAITGNHGYGIHLGERQDWEQSAFDCGDPIYYAEGGRYYRDQASRNVVQDNDVLDNGKDIVVHDDANTISHNRTGGIWVGSRIRQAAGEPVSGTVLTGNTGSVHYQFGGS